MKNHGSVLLTFGRHLYLSSCRNEPFLSVLSFCRSHGPLILIICSVLFCTQFCNDTEYINRLDITSIGFNMLDFKLREIKIIDSYYYV